MTDENQTMLGASNASSVAVVIYITEEMVVERLRPATWIR
jgi:hypothetical protein